MIEQQKERGDIEAATRTLWCEFNNLSLNDPISKELHRQRLNKVNLFYGSKYFESDTIGDNNSNSSNDERSENGDSDNNKNNNNNNKKLDDIFDIPETRGTEMIDEDGIDVEIDFDQFNMNEFFTPSPDFKHNKNGMSSLAMLGNDVSMMDINSPLPQAIGLAETEEDDPGMITPPPLNMNGMDELNQFVSQFSPQIHDPSVELIRNSIGILVTPEREIRNIGIGNENIDGGDNHVSSSLRMVSNHESSLTQENIDRLINDNGNIDLGNENESTPAVDVLSVLSANTDKAISKLESIRVQQEQNIVNIDLQVMDRQETTIAIVDQHENDLNNQHSHEALSVNMNVNNVESAPNDSAPNINGGEQNVENSDDAPVIVEQLQSQDNLPNINNNNNNNNNGIGDPVSDRSGPSDDSQSNKKGKSSKKQPIEIDFLNMEFTEQEKRDLMIKERKKKKKKRSDNGDDESDSENENDSESDDDSDNNNHDNDNDTSEDDENLNINEYCEKYNCSKKCVATASDKSKLGRKDYHMMPRFLSSEYHKNFFVESFLNSKSYYVSNIVNGRNGRYMSNMSDKNIKRYCQQSDHFQVTSEYVNESKVSTQLNRMQDEFGDFIHGGVDLNNIHYMSDDMNEMDEINEINNKNDEFDLSNVNPLDQLNIFDDAENNFQLDEPNPNPNSNLNSNIPEAAVSVHDSDDDIIPLMGIEPTMQQASEQGQSHLLESNLIKSPVANNNMSDKTSNNDSPFSFRLLSKLERLPLNHSKLSKRGIVNIRALKDTMHQMLSKIDNRDNMNDNDNENDNNNNNDGIENNSLSFQVLCNQLVESNQLTAKTKRLLTIPNLFITLLHLCNQYQFELSREPFNNEEMQNTSDESLQLADFYICSNSKQQEVQQENQQK